MMVEKMMWLGGGQARASRHPARWRPSPGLPAPCPVEAKPGPPAPCPVEAKPGPPGTLPGGGQSRASRHPARWRPSPGLPAPCPVEAKPGPPGTLPLVPDCGGGQARASRHPTLGTWLWWRPSPGLPAPCPWYLAGLEAVWVEAKPGPPGTLPGGGQAWASRHPALGTWLWWRPSPGLPAPCPVEAKPGPPGTLPLVPGFGGGQARASRHPALGTWLWWRPSPGLPAPYPWYLALVEAKPGPPGTLPLVPGFGGGQARASRHPTLGTWLWWRPSPGLPAPCPWSLAVVEAKPGPPGTLPLVPGWARGSLGGGQARASRHPALGTWLG